MKKLTLLLITFLVVSCVEEIPIDQVESEVFVSSDTTNNLPDPNPTPTPQPEIPKIPTPLPAPGTPVKVEAPIIENLSYEGSEYAAEILGGTTKVDIKVKTNIYAHCRYSEIVQGFSEMTPMTATDGFDHFQTISNLKNGDKKKYQIKCAQRSYSTDGFSYKFSSFKISNQVVPPVIVPPAVPPSDPQTIDSLRTAVIKIFNKQNTAGKSCIGCHGAGQPYEAYINLSLDIRLLEKDTTHIVAKKPLESLLYKKISSGSMNKYLADTADIKIINDWIMATDGMNDFEIGCKPGELLLDTKCYEVKDHPLRSFGYRKLIRDEVIGSINSSLGINISNFDESGDKILPGETVKHGFTNAYGVLTISSSYFQALELLADKVGSELDKQTSIAAIPCYDQKINDCSMTAARILSEKLLRTELSTSDLTPYQNFLNTSTLTKKQAYIDLIKAMILSPSFLFREEHGTGGITSELKGLGVSTPIVTDLFLIDANKNEIIQSIPINSNVIINTALTGLQLSIEAKGSNFKSVNFKSTDHNQTESAAPYVFGGDDGANIYPWKLGLGKHIVEISPFSEAAAAGTQGLKILINLELINSANSPKVQILSAPDSNYKFNAHEVASRLAFFLTGVAPDQELIIKAKDGSILNKSVREAQARRLMNTQKAKDHLALVFLESIGVKDLKHSKVIAADMIKESSLLIQEIFFNPSKKWTDVLSANYSYMNSRLAKIYDIPVNAGESNFVKVNYPMTSQRSGILSHASFLGALYQSGDGEKTNEIRRGLNLMENVLCEPIKPLPPGVDPDDDPALGLKGCKLDVRKASTTNPNGACFACHKDFDSIGMGFARFNEMGEYRPTEKADSNCSLEENFHTSYNESFTNIRDYTQAMSQSKKVGRCLAVKIKTFAYGATLDIKKINEVYVEMNRFKSSLNFIDLIIDIVSNDQFIQREGRDEI